MDLPVEVRLSAQEDSDAIDPKEAILDDGESEPKVIFSEVSICRYDLSSPQESYLGNAWSNHDWS